jgi:ABC-type amino acid transport substrate-binding protein
LILVRRILVAIALAVVLTSIIQAEAQTTNPPAATISSARELIVGTKEAPPFSMKAPDGTWQGISIELWRGVARENDLRYRFAEESNVQDLLDGVAAGKYDVAVAAMTPTAAREQAVDFTQPFYSSGLGIVIPVAGLAGWFPVFRAMTSFGFLQAVMALVGLALVAGFLIWLFERNGNENFGGGVTKGHQLGRPVVGLNHDAASYGQFQSTDGPRSRCRNLLDGDFDCCDRRIHRRHYFGADDEAVAWNDPWHRRPVVSSRRCHSRDIG